MIPFLNCWWWVIEKYVILNVFKGTGYLDYLMDDYAIGIWYVLSLVFLFKYVCVHIHIYYKRWQIILFQKKQDYKLYGLIQNLKIKMNLEKSEIERFDPGGGNPEFRA